MGKLPKQTSRRQLIKNLRSLGFDGPHQGGKGRAGDHPEFMIKNEGQRTVKLPNKHRGDIGEPLLKKIIAEAGLSVNEYLGVPEEDDGAEDQ